VERRPEMKQGAERINRQGSSASVAFAHEIDVGIIRTICLSTSAQCYSCGEIGNIGIWAIGAMPSLVLSQRNPNPPFCPLTRTQRHS